MTLGFVFSQGRGGWLAALTGIVWFLWRQRVRVRSVVVLAAILSAVVYLAFAQVPTFRSEVERSFNPTPDHASGRTFADVYGAGRVHYWIQEGPKLAGDPILGRGLFNRFPSSGLDWVGSHSFWLQMFLEAGAPGGMAILGIVWLLWVQARRAVSTPLRQPDSAFTVATPRR